MAFVTFVALDDLARRTCRGTLKTATGDSTCRCSSRLLHHTQSSSLTSLSLIPRDEILRLGALVGNLCSAVLTSAPLDPPRDAFDSNLVEDEHFPPTLTGLYFWSDKSSARDDIARAMGSILLALFVAARACSLDLRTCILRKIELNRRKYPVELCKGKSGKYTVYSDQTGITKTIGQSTIGTNLNELAPSSSSGECGSNKGQEEDVDTVEGVTYRIRSFATERMWSRYHTPRNILLALMGELGELAEIFQWKGDGPKGAPEGLAGWSEDQRDKVGQEIADISIYLLRLADVCGVNVGQEAMMAADVAGIDML